jgi:hypothetical protein
MRIKSLLRVLVMSVVALVLFAAPVVAASWGPIKSYYNGSEVVRSWGDATIEDFDGVNDFYLKDSKNDGNAVYAKTRFVDFFYPFYYSTKTSAEYENITKHLTHSRGAVGRMLTLACAQMGWPVPDSCTSWTDIAP